MAANQEDSGEPVTILVDRVGCHDSLPLSDHQDAPDKSFGENADEQQQQHNQENQ